MWEVGVREGRGCGRRRVVVGGLPVQVTEGGVGGGGGHEHTGGQQKGGRRGLRAHEGILTIL